MAKARKTTKTASKKSTKGTKASKATKKAEKKETGKLSMMAYIKEAIIENPAVTTAEMKERCKQEYPDNKVIEVNFPSIMARCRRTLIDKGTVKAADIEAGKRVRVSKKKKATKETETEAPTTDTETAEPAEKKSTKKKLVKKTAKKKVAKKIIRKKKK